MSTDAEGGSYIRGGGGTAVDVRKAATGILVILAAVLAALLVLLGLDLARAHDRAGRLRTSGVPVTFTVTGCRALASGTGITTVGYTCTGTFAQNGRRYHETLRSSAQLYPAGTPVAAVVAPGDPGSVSAVASGALRGPDAKAYAVPSAVLVLLAGALALLWHLHRGRRS